MKFFLKQRWLEQEVQRAVMDADARADMPGQLAALPHGHTHYQLDDPSDLPILVCIHGWSTASYVWNQLRRDFLSERYRVLTYDLYGRGYSDRPDVDYSAALFSTQLAELLEHLQLNTRRLTVVGYSMGGAIAARFVSERMQSVDRLLLIAPAGMRVRLPIVRGVSGAFPRTFGPAVSLALRWLLLRSFQSAVDDFPNDPDVARVAACQTRELSYRGYIRSLVSSLWGTLSEKMEREHCAIAGSDMPVRALFAQKDILIPFRSAKKAFDRWHGHGKSYEMTGLKHELTYTNSDEVIEKIRDFL
ncbi:alpha/beta hydrolase [uncultured Ruegeria sp.]|uniref:alpha/beta fold hydrolase n=1 Tax=uncultured Ruegeria sp. TaxID=259304 RepID=UPI00262392E0|nr:alpha/beta hydrolase [uncultured Ruegeria sp.]